MQKNKQICWGWNAKLNILAYYAYKNILRVNEAWRENPTTTTWLCKYYVHIFLIKNCKIKKKKQISNPQQRQQTTFVVYHKQHKAILFLDLWCSCERERGGGEYSSDNILDVVEKHSFK